MNDPINVSMTGQYTNAGTWAKTYSPTNHEKNLAVDLDFPRGLGGFLFRSILVLAPALEAIKNNRPWSNNQPWTYATGAFTIIGSTALLAHFYKTRKFVVDEKFNYSEIAKFVVGFAWVAYVNHRYFTST